VQRKSTQYLIRVGVLSALAFGLMLIEVPLLPSATYLKYDPSELAALVGGFALGPAAGVIIELIKNLLYLLLSGKATLVGEAANFLAGAVMVGVASVLYWRHKSRLVAGLSLVAGSLAATAVMSVANYYVFLPLWNVPREAIPAVLTGAVIPFNLLKAGLSSAVTFLAYKRVRGYLTLEAVEVAPAAAPSRSHL